MTRPQSARPHATAMALAFVTATALVAGCAKRSATTTGGAGGAFADGGAAASTAPERPAAPPRTPLPPLPPGQVYVFDDHGDGATAISIDAARGRGLLVVNLGDAWAPFIFQDSDNGGDDGDAGGAGGAAGPDGSGATGDGAGGAEPAGAAATLATTPVRRPPAAVNRYRATFIELANERIDPDGRPTRAGTHNYLEPFGIPPTLSVLAARVERDSGAERRACDAAVDVEGLRSFGESLSYQDRERARRQVAEATRDVEWVEQERTARGLPDQAATLAALRGNADPKVAARAERTVRGQARLRAVRAAQAFLQCEGLLSPRSRFVSGSFDLPTHEALAEWERKNDVFGWGILGGDTLAALPQPVMESHLDTFRRILAERVADAAGIVEDGSASRGGSPATYRDASGAEHEVPNLVGDAVSALLAAIRVGTPDELRAFLRQQGEHGLGSLRVAIPAPTLPPYYGPRMDLSVVIDRGDVWYDFPFDVRGKPVEQHRAHYPSLTLFADWQGQNIPLVRWRTTIGSWRSELHANGKVYYKYKNSDVGPRVWKHIVAGPVWIPPDGTPARDLLVRRVLDIHKGPETVVNTEVMGPGFQSAYGLVMAIHINKSGFDNQIRTHGSVDYTSIARRFSHGCHRLVNNRAVRLFDFVLRHVPFRRIGQTPLNLKRQFTVDDVKYEYTVNTRGYYYELQRPVSVEVTEGQVMGKVKEPVTAYVRKAGVDYSDVNEAERAESALGSGDAATSARAIGGTRTVEPAEIVDPEPPPAAPAPGGEPEAP